MTIKKILMICFIVVTAWLLSGCGYSYQCGNTKIIDQVGLGKEFIQHVCKQTKSANRYLGIKAPYTIDLVRNDNYLLTKGYSRLAYATDDYIRMGVYPSYEDRVLFHEIRHIWQFARGASGNTHKLSYEEWLQHPLEMDANRFARKAVSLWGRW